MFQRFACYTVFFSTAAVAFFAGLAGLDFPNEPLAILPFFVLISPRPMLVFLMMLNKIKKQDIFQYVLPLMWLGNHYNLADNSFPALNLATFLALILITAPV